MSKFKMFYSGLALATLMVPAVSMAQSDYYDDYNYDYNYDDYNYDYNYDYDYDSSLDSGTSAALGIGFMLMMGVAGLVGLAFLIFEIVMIVDCVKRDFEQRTVWMIVLIAGIFFGFGWIASLIYYFTVKRKNVGHMKAAGGTTPPAAK